VWEEATGIHNLKIFPKIPTVIKHFAISLRCSMARVQLTVRASQQLNITLKIEVNAEIAQYTFMM